MDIFSVCGIAVMTAVLAVTVRQFRPELAIQVSIAGGAVLTLSVLTKLAGSVETVKSFYAQTGLDGGWLETAIKLIGIAYITQISAELCRDAGESALALKAELCGRAIMLSCAMPALISLLKVLVGLAEMIG